MHEGAVALHWHDRFCTHGEEALLEFHRAFGGMRVDERAEKGFRRLRGRADADLRGKLGERGDDRIAFRALGNNQAPRARAALTAGRERRMHNEIRGSLGVDRRPDDQRIVAAEFKRQDHVGTAGELLMDQSARVCGASEKHAVEAV